MNRSVHISVISLFSQFSFNVLLQTLHHRVPVVHKPQLSQYQSWVFFMNLRCNVCNSTDQLLQFVWCIFILIQVSKCRLCISCAGTFLASKIHYLVCSNRGVLLHTVIAAIWTCLRFDSMFLCCKVTELDI